MTLTEHLDDLIIISDELHNLLAAKWHIIMNECYSDNKETIDKISVDFKKFAEELEYFKEKIKKEI